MYLIVLTPLYSQLREVPLLLLKYLHSILVFINRKNTWKWLQQLIIFNTYHGARKMNFSTILLPSTMDPNLCPMFRFNWTKNNWSIQENCSLQVQYFHNVLRWSGISHPYLSNRYREGVLWLMELEMCAGLLNYCLNCILY